MAVIMVGYILTKLGMIMTPFFLEQVSIMDITVIHHTILTTVILLIIWIIILPIIMEAITHIIMGANTITISIIHITTTLRITIPT
jgi:hypothetical protein